MASQLWMSLLHWELSASLDESITRLEAFICTFSATSDGSFAVEELIFSMWEDSTQTLSLLVAHRKRDTITRSRMATLSVEALADRSQQRAEAEICQLILNGLRLRVQKVEMCFGDLCMSWIQKRLLLPSGPCSGMLIGSSDPTLCCMSRQQEYPSARGSWTDEIIGYNSLVFDWENHS